METAFSNKPNRTLKEKDAAIGNPDEAKLLCESFEALGVSGEQFRRFFMGSSDGVALGKIIFEGDKPVDYVTLEINEAYERIFGVKRHDFVGQRITQAIPGIEKDASNLLALYGKVAATGESVKQELYFTVYSRYFDVTSYSPKKGYFITIFSVITEERKHQLNQETKRTQTEDALKSSEERFRSVLDSSLDVIYRFNLKTGRYEYMSPAIRSLGFEPEEMMAMTSDEVFSRVHPNDLSMLTAELARLQDTGHVSVEYRFMGKDGVYRWWSNQMILIKDQNGLPLYRDGDVRDVSESKSVQEALKQHTAKLELTQKQLEENAVKLEEYANQMEMLAEQRAKQVKDAERLAAIGQTAGMVGHDIRNPLQAMMSDVWLLKELLLTMPYSETRGEVAESLDGLEKNIGYVNKIVADLQDYARPLKPEYSIIDISQIISIVLKTVILPDNIKLVVNVKAPNKIESEATFIQRSLTNLVNNAIQAMPNGGNLTINVEEFNEKIAFSVKDTGEGIPEDVKAKIFSPMTTTKSKGQGLGLAVVKRLTEAVGGTVSFESQVGNGATFRLEFPITRPTNWSQQ